MFYEIEPGHIINLSRLIRASVYQKDRYCWLMKAWFAGDPNSDGVVIAEFTYEAEAKAALDKLLLKANQVRAEG